MPGRFPLVALVVLDGWGLAPPGPGNAVELAETPVFDRLWREFPHTEIAASGEAVGLPPGQMGNSEVGHLTIGSGRILFQDLMRVNAAIRDGSLYENEALVGASPEMFVRVEGTRVETCPIAGTARRTGDPRAGSSGIALGRRRGNAPAATP